MINLMLLTAEPEYALRAQNAGVDRIFLDLEYINKVERQLGRNTLISHNDIASVAKIHNVLDKSELLVRVNPINPNLKNEIDRVIADGADIIMLPMVYDAEDVKIFVDYVSGRARTCPMIETAQAMARIDDILNVDGVDELFIGLNDLHIGLGLKFMFETLSGGLVEYMAQKIKAKGLPFGFGGMAKIGEGILPAERILAEHYRLGSNSVILSRTFRNEVDAEGKKVLDLPTEIKKIRDEEIKIQSFTDKDFEVNQLEVKSCVKKILSNS